jgi:putative Holliday junction resolvase
MTRYVALDVGSRTVGVAQAQTAVGIPMPLFTLERRSVKKDTAALQERALGPDVEAVVVGLPVEDDGSERRSAKLARQIGDAVAALGYVVHYQDESFTTVEAERRLVEAGVDARRRKAMIDQVAAAVILEDWLEERR